MSKWILVKDKLPKEHPDEAKKNYFHTAIPVIVCDSKGGVYDAWYGVSWSHCGVGDFFRNTSTQAIPDVVAWMLRPAPPQGYKELSTVRDRYNRNIEAHKRGEYKEKKSEYKLIREADWNFEKYPVS